MTDLGFCKKINDSRTYTLCGMPEYLAPEVILGKEYSFSVDWWAIGVLIYEMSAGYPPFFARNPMSIYEKIVTGKYSCPSYFSKSLKDLLPHILQTDRSKRYSVLKNGTKDIKDHEWFRTLDWEAVLARKTKPSFVPHVSGGDDTTNFDFCEEEDLRVASKAEFAEEFKTIEVC